MLQQLGEAEGPVVAVSDWMKAYPDQIARWLPDRFYSLGTDGYGRSDARPALRRHFEISAEYVVVAALSQLARQGKLAASVAAKAIQEFDIDPDRLDPVLA